MTAQPEERTPDGSPRSYADCMESLGRLAPDDYNVFVFAHTPEHYATRVAMAGFEGTARVLDAGCGYGQWAVALAQQNGHVVGIDHSPLMIEASREYADWSGVQNVEFHQMSLPDLDFPDGHFDLVWCWGVFMFTNPRETLREFSRLLRPGGKLLVGCCNSRGRWLYKALKSLRPRHINIQVFKVSVGALVKGHGRAANPNYTTIRSARTRVEREGLELLEADVDGCIDVTGEGRSRPMFAGRFLGFQNNIEFIARKPET